MRMKLLSTFAVLIMVTSCAICCVQGSDATYSGYGDVYEIELAPGFKYTYTPTYPSDLEVTTSILKHEDGIEASASNGTVTIRVVDGVTSGTYDAIVKAYTNTAGIEQTSYQHIRVDVVSGLSVSGSINNIVLGTSINFEPTGKSDMGDVTWTVKSGTTLPAGLTLSNGKVTGTPTEVGKQTVSLTATAKGESRDLVVSFTVYNKIVDNENETIFSHGNTVSSTPIVQTGNDLNVSWSLKSGDLPSGFSLNSSTGVISGSSTILSSYTVTIVGKTGAGITPSQTIEKTIIIRSEPDISITKGPSSSGCLYTFSGAGDRTLQMDTYTNTSMVTYSVSGLDGVSISDKGLVTYKDTTPTGTFTVTVTTGYGQTESKSIRVVNETVGTLTGASSLSTTAGTSATTTITSNIDGVWSITVSPPSGVNVSIDDGVVTLSSSSPCSSFTGTVKLTTDGGQEITKKMTFTVVNSLVFNNNPTNGVIAYEV